MAANAYPTARGLAAKYVPGGQLVDVSAASISYAPIPSQGIIIDALCTISAATTSADSIVTVRVFKGSALTSSVVGTITVAFTGSAPGSTFTMVPTGSEIVRSVSRGDVIVFDSDGAGSTTSIANFLLVLQET